MSTEYFADIATAEKVIRDLYPNAQDISFVEHSYDNLVGLIDDTYVARFPRNHAALLRSRYERRVLHDLAGMTEVQLPKVLQELDNPPCVIESFLPGTHLSPAEVIVLPHHKQVALGNDLATFAFQMHTTLDVNEARKLRADLGLDTLPEEPWDIYFKKLFSHNLPNDQQNAAKKKYYEEWRSLQLSPDVVVHDDLHTENMLFRDGKLVGVLDFGDTNIGSPEQELRQLYRISDTVLEAAVQQYSALSGHEINLRGAQVWAIVQELAVCMRHFIHHEPIHAAYIRACRNLNRWFATDIWGHDIRDDSVTNSRQ
jgi:aminoglycoside phosphotransferase (APT) family kinase protein